ncbi:MAG: alpha/beta fold hydrolase [Comamonas sp.]
MPSTIDMVVPPMGEAIDAARLVAWIVQPGEAFEAGRILVEIETDKSVIEVPAPQSGVMVAHLVAVDGLIQADTAIARIEVEQALAEEAQPAPAVQREDVAAAAEAPPRSERQPQPVLYADLAASARQFVTPAARRLALQQNIAVDAIEGTGPQGRVTLADIQAAPSQTAVANAGRVLARAAAHAGKHELWVATRHGDIRAAVWEPAQEARGARGTCFLVHGMFGDMDTWAALAHTLSHAGMRVVAMDLPCHGASRSQATRFEDIVDAAAEVLASQCPGPVTLIGHSFGAAVAARVQRRPGIVVRQLFLIAPVGLGTEIEQGFLQGMAHAGTNEALERELQKLTASGMLPSAAFIDGLRRNLETRQSSVLELCAAVGRHGVQQINIRPDLQQADCHCTIIHGRQDAIVPWQHALNAPPQVALHLVPEAGHMPQWEAGKLVAGVILRTEPAAG